jgi:hypothetical protein
MSLVYAIAGFIFGYRAYREYRERQIDPERNKVGHFFLLSLLLTSMGMCGLWGFLAQITR